MAEPKPIKAPRKPRAASGAKAAGHCLCGAVALEIDVPARWAWHDHSRASRLAHSAAYATYVGSWRSRFRVIKGAKTIGRFEDPAGKSTRSFCTKCGTPVLYERKRAPKMVNVPRALFATRTGREPLYHEAIEERQEWRYMDEPLRPLKGYPGLHWTRPKRKKPMLDDGFL